MEIMWPEHKLQTWLPCKLFLQPSPRFADCNSACVQKSAEQIYQAFAENSEDGIQKAQADLTKEMKSIQVQEKMNDFNSSRESKPFFCVMNQYNTMVLNMMAFVRAVRTGSSISQPWKQILVFVLMADLTMREWLHCTWLKWNLLEGLILTSAMNSWMKTRLWIRTQMLHSVL